MTITVKTIASSISQGIRLDTFECEFPRVILAELNKHRALSNSVESSRAITLDSVEKKLRDNMFIPKFTRKQAGMQGYGEIDQDGFLTKVWEDAGWSAFNDSKLLHRAGVHKQVCNRMTENYTYVKGIISGTEWDNFFNLRIHHTAEPHIQDLAIKIYQERRNTVPMELFGKEWHVPYIERSRTIDGVLWYKHPETHDVLGIREAKEISLAMCAQVSYRNIDSSDEKVKRVLSRLFPEGDVVHAVPAEHIATPMMQDMWSGNFRGWMQWRQTIVGNVCNSFTPVDFEERINKIKEMNNVND